MLTDIIAFVLIMACIVGLMFLAYRLGQYSDAVALDKVASYEDGWQKGYERAVQDVTEVVMAEAYEREQAEIEREINRDIEDYGY